MEKVPSPCERQAGRPAAGKTDKARWRGHDAGKAETGEARTCPRTPRPRPCPAEFSGLCADQHQCKTTHETLTSAQDGARGGCGLFYKGSGDFQGPILQFQPSPCH